MMHKQKNTATLIIWLKCIWRFYRATCSDISSYMKTKSSENNFASSRVPFFRIAFLVHSSQRQNCLNATNERNERNGRARKRFKFLWSIQFVILWCRAHFWCGFSSFRNLLCRFLSVVLVLCLILHTHLPLPPLDRYMSWHNLNWQENLANFSAADVLCFLFVHHSLSLLLITFHVSDDRLVSDWNIAKRMGVWLNILAFLWTFYRNFKHCEWFCYLHK